MSAIAQPARSRPSQASPLAYFLAFVSLVFIGILIFAYVVTKRAHPIYLDEHGRPINSQPTHEHGGT